MIKIIENIIFSFYRLYSMNLAEEEYEHMAAILHGLHYTSAPSDDSLDTDDRPSTSNDDIDR